MHVIHGLVLRARIADGVLVVSATGPLTHEASEALRLFVARQAAGVAVVVVDLRAAVHLMTDDDWVQTARRASTVEPVSQPVAFVVSPPALDASMEHCRRMATHGLLRVTTVSLPAALQWAAGQCVQSRPGVLVPAR